MYVVHRIVGCGSLLKAEPIFAGLRSDFVALGLMESHETNRGNIYDGDAAVAI